MKIEWITKENIGSIDLETCTHYVCMDTSLFPQLDIHNHILYTSEDYITYPFQNVFVGLVCIPYKNQMIPSWIDALLIGGDDHTILEYEQLLDIKSYCEQYKITFLFYSTGTYFKKDGKVYTIDTSKQIEQANKSNLTKIYSWHEMDILKRIRTSKFRSGFHLKKNDFDYIQKQGMDTIQNHAYDFIEKRLSPSFIENDGKQTPMRGHPVFVAQHAVACCCRGCLKKWHNIDSNKDLNKKEIDYIVQTLMRWIERELNNGN